MDQHERTRRIFEASSKAFPWAKVPFTPPGLKIMQGLGHLNTPFRTINLVPKLALNLPPSPVISVINTKALFGGLDWMTRMTAPMHRVLDFMSKAGRELKLFDEAGWLPHYTTPFERLETLEGAEALNALLDEHYRTNWAEVRASLESHLTLYGVDDKAKRVFRRAMDLHEGGFYDAAVLYIFPEIERLARAELHDGQLDGFTSQRRLRELASEFYSDQIQPGGFRGMTLFQCLDDHLYSRVKTADALEAARNDPVPNRHAAIHGLVDYDSHQSSVNVLIMADYVLQVFSAVKASGGLSNTNEAPDAS